MDLIDLDGCERDATDGIGSEEFSDKIGNHVKWTQHVSSE